MLSLYDLIHNSLQGIATFHHCQDELLLEIDVVILDEVIKPLISSASSGDQLVSFDAQIDPLRANEIELTLNEHNWDLDP